MKDVIAAVQAESDRMGSMIPVILDAKRGDIASTAEAYAKSAFESLGAHAITLSPYLGKDSIDPFLAYKEKGRVPAVQNIQPRRGGFAGFARHPSPSPDGTGARGERESIYMNISPILPNPGTPAITSASLSAQPNWMR